MKNIITSMLLFGAAALNAQSYNLAFVNPTVNGSKFKVTVNMSADKSFSLGANNIRFTYPTKDLANPRIVSENFPQGFGETTLLGTSTETGIVSVNTAYTAKPNANILVVGKEAKELVTLEFDIISSNPDAKLVFRTGKSFPKCAVITDDRSTILDEGKFNDVKLNQPIKLQPTINVKSSNFDVVNVSPNPTTDIINVNFSAIEDSKIEVSVADAAGKIVKLQAVHAVKGANFLSFDVRELPAGTYFVAIGDKTQKVVKL